MNTSTGWPAPAPTPSSHLCVPSRARSLHFCQSRTNPASARELTGDDERDLRRLVPDEPVRALAEDDAREPELALESAVPHDLDRAALGDDADERDLGYACAHTDLDTRHRRERGELSLDARHLVVLLRLVRFLRRLRISGGGEGRCRDGPGCVGGKGAGTRPS
jgi:hypothetical protein